MLISPPHNDDDDDGSMLSRQFSKGAPGSASAVDWEFRRGGGGDDDDADDDDGGGGDVVIQSRMIVTIPMMTMKRRFRPELPSDNLAARAQAGMEGNVDHMRKEELMKYA